MAILTQAQEPARYEVLPHFWVNVLKKRGREMSQVRLKPGSWLARPTSWPVPVPPVTISTISLRTADVTKELIGRWSDGIDPNTEDPNTGGFHSPPAPLSLQSLIISPLKQPAGVCFNFILEKREKKVRVGEDREGEGILKGKISMRKH